MNLERNYTFNLFLKKDKSVENLFSPILSYPLSLTAGARVKPTLPDLDRDTAGGLTA
jgi:hypothetical protein